VIAIDTEPRDGYALVPAPMERHGRIRVIRLVASSILLLGGCAGSRGPEPSPSEPDPKSAAGAKPAAEADPAPDVVIDLEVLAADPAAALPGTLVRHGRYDVRQLMHEGGFVVAMTEELVVHELGGRFVGRIASKSDETPMPPSFLVFVTDDGGRLERVIWQGLPGTSVAEHEFSRISARSDGPKLEIERTKRLSSSIQRVTVPGAWTLDGALALELLPLWSAAATARPEQAEWVSIQLQPVSKPERIRLAQRGKETIKVGGHEVDVWRYQAVGESPLTAVVWVDEQGLVVRRLEQSEGEASTQWDTIYVPLAGDRLSR
jgi:hypothetical protein